jgi:hypothetical protein
MPDSRAMQYAILKHRERVWARGKRIAHDYIVAETQLAVVRTMRHTMLAATGILVLAAAPLSAQWRIDGWLGDAWSAHTPVTFSQAGSPDITTNADWAANPWEPTWYYSIRFAKWSDSSGWAFHYMHDKLYLNNPPPGVDYFRITNGVNFFLAERLWRRKGWELGVGVCPIFVVPVSEVRGLVYNKANGIFGSVYELGGAGLETDVSRRVRLLPFVFGILTIKATAAYLDVNIADGKARLTNLALHATYGLSLQSKKK